jgi:hypothetical protein
MNPVKKDFCLSAKQLPPYHPFILVSRPLNLKSWNIPSPLAGPPSIAAPMSDFLTAHWVTARTFSDQSWDSSFWCSEGLFSPLVLLHDLSLFLGSEIVLNVKELADFWNGAVLDQTGDLSASKLQEWLNIQIVCCKDELEQNLLVKINEL